MKSLLKHLGSARDKRNSGSNDTKIKFVNVGKGPVCTYLQKNGQLILHDEFYPSQLFKTPKLEKFGL